MASDAAGQPDAVHATYEELGVRLFTPAPEGFDPISASDEELLRYGYPHRPDPQLHPQLHARWEQMMSAPISVTAPQFVVPHPPEPVPVPAEPGTSPYPPTATSANWSGSVMYPADQDGVAVVAGQWTVPPAAEPQFGQPPYACATWVGIDGFSRDPASFLPGDLVQAGTTQQSGQQPFAWWWWDPEYDPVTQQKKPPVKISDFPVSTGDVIHCMLRVDTPGQVSFYLLNRTRQVLKSFFKPAPTADSQVAGGVADWILEQPGGAGSIPDYGCVTFEGCYALTAQNRLLSPGTGELLTLTDATGYPVSVPQVVDDYTIQVCYQPVAI
jgi:hypothetical protein